MAGRITRKELKTDKFALEVEQTVDFVTQHRRELVVYGSTGLAVILIALAVYFYMGREHSARQRSLAEAIQLQEAPVGPPNPNVLVTFPTEDAKRTAVSKALSEIAARYPGSDEAAVAKYYLGSLAADQGKMAEAEKLFKEVIASTGSNYASLARFSMAQVYSAEGRNADAQKILRELMDNPTVFVSKDQATIALAKAIAPSKPDEARKLLEPLRTKSGAVSASAVGLLGELQSQKP